ncbi:hypothetical protein ACE1CI_37445 [Aerosakkonemataceae cyanobacterium BLCC-F50]|uniref:Uncharacterized protein n=1 Tax=Floridaenema flaviceps BLCC-F50 TaxID=3153642 RepID=A0ABV4Y3R0_9CYAN
MGGAGGPPHKCPRFVGGWASSPPHPHITIITLFIYTYLKSIVFSPDGQMLISGSDDKTIRFGGAINK